jgi:nucleotide-binding universal stress UspA family protein
MIKKILAAYDGSEPAAKAYTYALDLAKKIRCRLAGSSGRSPARAS